MYFSYHRLLLARQCAVLLLLTAAVSHTAARPSGDALSFNLDIRPVYYYVHTTGRDGSQNPEHTMNLRTRAGLTYRLSDQITFRGRTAARLSTSQDSFRFLLDDHTGGSGSYPAGSITLDIFQIRWQLMPDLRITAGRFQGRFPLEGFIPKSADRYYAANLAISHTDGIWLEWNASEKWRLHLIGSHNGTAGSSHAARKPLRFDESPAARISGFANIQHRDTRGRWAQRELSISFTPKNFYRDDKLRNLAALSTRWMYRPAVSTHGEEYLVGGELGFIPVAPKPADAGLMINEDRLLLGSSAISWQVSAYANNLFERHRIGILYGQTDPHWLISSSFAPNVTMAEFRYRFTIAPWIHYEFRLRRRGEIFLPEGAAQTRRIFDFYTRFTVSL